jgi:hypothetical protein
VGASGTPTVRSGSTTAGRRRLLRVVLGITVAALAVVAVLGFVPLESAPFSASIPTHFYCWTGSGCLPGIHYVAVGNSRSDRFTGAWSTNGTPGAIFFEVGRGPLPQPGCILCAGVAYSSNPNQTSGTFSVVLSPGASGPFYIIATSLGRTTNATTKVTGTVYSVVL